MGCGRVSVITTVETAGIFNAEHAVERAATGMVLRGEGVGYAATRRGSLLMSVSPRFATAIVATAVVVTRVPSVTIVVVMTVVVSISVVNTEFVTVSVSVWEITSGTPTKVRASTLSVVVEAIVFVSVAVMVSVKESVSVSV